MDRTRIAGLIQSAVSGSLAAVVLLAASAVAQAHYVWLEGDGTGPARAYFGEFGEDLREKTGGVPGRIATARAFLIVPAAPLEERSRGEGTTAYDRHRHVATLSFVADQGIVWTGK